MANRPSVDQYFLAMADLASLRSTCARRKVGCILVDKDHRVLATGYNGVASGQPHCIERPCPGAGLPSGTGLEACQAIHAEANALVSCRHPEDVWVAYVTASPCIHCTRLLLNTPCRRVVFAERYPHFEAELLWTEAGRGWCQLHERRIGWMPIV